MIHQARLSYDIFQVNSHEEFAFNQVLWCYIQMWFIISDVLILFTFLDLRKIRFSDFSSSSLSRGRRVAPAS